MALRLVLMSVVAGLGLTLPSRQDVSMWGHSARSWVDARFAGWDSRSSAGGGTFLYVPEAVGPSTKVVSESEAADLESTLLEENAARDVDSIGAKVAADHAVGPVGPIASVSDDAGSDDRAFAVVVEEIAKGFETDVAALEARDRDRQADLAFGAVVDEMASAFATDSSRLAEGREATGPTPSFEPMELDDDLYTGMAYALNRESEGISEIAPAIQEQANPGDRLTDAVRLTREAVFAWARLLHGPAVVTIDR